MRALAGLWILGIAMALGSGGLASAESWKQCQKMTRQIDQFYDVLQRAEDRENPMWERSTREHIGRLEKRRLGLCPRFLTRQQEISAQRQHQQNVEEMKKLMKAAADMAMKYYTGGLY